MTYYGMYLFENLTISFKSLIEIKSGPIGRQKIRGQLSMERRAAYTRPHKFNHPISKALQ